MLNITAHQDAILHVHNQLRNQLATGKLEHLMVPDRMAVLQWSPLLEELATLNVKQCALNYDCHNTPDYRNSGQNLALQNLTSAIEIPDEDLIKNNIEKWWEQHKNVTQEKVDSFPGEQKLIEWVIRIVQNYFYIYCIISASPPAVPYAISQ